MPKDGDNREMPTSIDDVSLEMLSGIRRVIMEKNCKFCKSGERAGVAYPLGKETIKFKCNQDNGFYFLNNDFKWECDRFMENEEKIYDTSTQRLLQQLRAHQKNRQ